VWGFTESDGTVEPEVLRADAGDERLPVFGADGPQSGAGFTVALQDGPVRATASAYGEPFAYRPEDRPFMAIDGDPATAWRVADRAPAEGEFIRLDVAEPVDHVTLRQPVGADAVRHIGGVTITVDGGTAQRVALDERSFSPAGQRIEIGPTAAPASVVISIESVRVPDPTIGPALAAVGFAEIDVGLGPAAEVVRPPRELVADGIDADATSLTYVFTRLRTRPNDRWRSDPERAIVREVELSGTRSFTPSVTVRLDQRASDELLRRMFGIDGAVASARLTGVATAAGWAATDDDPETAWITPFGDAAGSSLEVDGDGGERRIRIVQPAGDYSPITAVRVEAGDRTWDLPVPSAGGNGVSVVRLPERLPSGQATIAITGVEPRFTLDRRYAEPIELPAAIAELSIGERTLLPDRIDTGCRGDLVQVDGEPVDLRVFAPVADLLAGEPVAAVPCGEDGLTLDAGVHRLTTTPGAISGLHVDRVVLASDEHAGGSGGPDAMATVTSTGRLDRTVVVDGCPEGCWLVLGEGFHELWEARTDAGDLGAPQLVDGGFNGWWIPPADGPTEVRLRWTAQTPLNIALLLTTLAVLACIALAVFDRRRLPAPEPAPPVRFASGAAPAPRRTRWIAAATWVVAAAVLIGWWWALVAAVAAAALVLALGRPRWAGWVTIGLVAVIGGVILWVVRRERPFPNAGWPARFEWLHGLGLFAAVALLVTVATGVGERRSTD
jgi:arabinofuranan 3-O-arabinosyltransferase